MAEIEKKENSTAGEGNEVNSKHLNDTVYFSPSQRKIHDSNVTFEEYNFYAKKTRKEQLLQSAPRWQWRTLISRKTKLEHGPLPAADEHFSNAEPVVSDAEWSNASRAYRTAGWGAVFYLITTDILGPFAVPFSIGTLGFGPGVAVFTAFGTLSVYSGYTVWRVFMGVDSHEFPARNYGDLAFRTCGTIPRHIVNLLQSLALLLILGQVAIMTGQNISEMSMYRICYIVCPLIFVIVGFGLTQIRTLRSYGWIANFSFWMNILAIFVSMGAVAHNDPNFSIATLGSVGSAVDPSSIAPDAQNNYPPVLTYAGLPSTNLIGSINGVLSGVLAYAGVQLFVEFMAEMRRPHDFLKGMLAAQAVIYTCYVVFGCFVYHYQGQYTFNPAYLGVSNYGLQTTGNLLTLLSGIVAASLYANIGIKVFYNNIFVDLFKAPLLTTRTAFVIAAAIPAYVYFVSIISASCLVSLSYTIPPLIALGFDLKRHTMGTFEPSAGRVSRAETGLYRYLKGFFAGGMLQICLNVWNLLFLLASLGLSGLGMYASIEGFIGAFEIPQVNSFSCISPLNLNGGS